jgi:8-oxo-dGTP pyrophosphatase MutT (NUDIX family)
MESKKLSDDAKKDREKDKREDNHLNNHRYNLRNVYCVNCGEKGHVLKECDGPITSFGIIAFKTCKDESDCLQDTNSTLKDILKQLNPCAKDTKYPKIKFLMIQRKDTMGYIDFVRGKYDIRPGFEKERDKKIRVCLDEMTQKEKDNLLLKDFDTIWNDLWVNHDSKCFKNEYELAKKKYINLNIPDLIKKSSTTYVFQEFGFPKGRRNMKETNIACAEREFFEETGYDKDCYDFIKNYPIIKEEFMGTNNVEYRHIYYLVKIKDRVPPPKIDINNKVQTGEVRNIGWFTLNECLKLIRPYDIAKKNMIKSVSTDIENMNAQYNCSKIFFASNSRREEIFSSVEMYNKLCEEYLTGTDYLIDTNF